MPTKTAPTTLMDLFDNIIAATNTKSGTVAVWRELPPDLPTFVTSPAYLGQPPLSPRQERKLTEALGKDPTKVFDGSRTITQAVPGRIRWEGFGRLRLN